MSAPPRRTYILETVYSKGGVRSGLLGIGFMIQLSVGWRLGESESTQDLDFTGSGFEERKVFEIV